MGRVDLPKLTDLIGLFKDSPVDIGGDWEESDSSSILFSSTGEAVFLYDDQLSPVLDIGQATIERASHVEPEGLQWVADMSPSTKTCVKCNLPKPIEHFYMRKSGTRRNDCKQCKVQATSRARRKQYAEHPEVYAKALEKGREYSKKKTASRKYETFVHYSGGSPKCACCGETEVQFLTLDHINNDGALHRRQLEEQENVKPGADFYRWLKKHGYPDGFQVLCFNCNCAKGLYGKCPHQTKGKPILGPFDTHGEAIAAERDWLWSNNFGRKT